MLHRNMNVKWNKKMLKIDDVVFMCDLITQSGRRLNQDWLWGSPRYKTLVYKVPGWDITYTRERISTDPEKNIKMFERVFRYGVTYQSHKLSHNDYRVELREMISWRTNPTATGYESTWDHMPLLELEYTGDVASLMDAIVYWKLQQSLD